MVRIGNTSYFYQNHNIPGYNGDGRSFARDIENFYNNAEMDEEFDILMQGDNYGVQEDAVLNVSIGGKFKSIETNSIWKRLKHGKFGKWLSVRKWRFSDTSNHPAVSINDCPLDLLSSLPCEMRHKIIQALPPSEHLKLRILSRRWQYDMQILLRASVHLTNSKLKRFKKNLRKSNSTLTVNNYSVHNLQKCIKVSHLAKLPIPKSLTIGNEVSTKNFQKLMKVWPDLENIDFELEALCDEYLKANLSPKYSGRLPQNLKRLGINLTPSSEFPLVEVLKHFQLRMNLKHIVSQTFSNLRVISYQILNFKNAPMCTYLEPVLKLIGSCYLTLRDIKISFDNGCGSDFDPLRLPQVHYSVQTLGRNQGLPIPNLLENLKKLKLVNCELHVPTISGCPVASSICNQLETIVSTQSGMSRFVLENQIGISLPFFQEVVAHNECWLTHLDVSLPLSFKESFNLQIFSSCTRLTSLRLKRCFVYENNFMQNPTLVGFKFLPTKLKKLSLVRLEFTLLELSLGITRMPNLEALILDQWSYPFHYISTCSRMVKLFQYYLVAATVGTLKSLKVVSICFLQEHLTKAVYDYLCSNGSDVHPLIQTNTWKFNKVYRKIAYAPPSNILLYKDRDYCKIQWFTPFVYQKVRL